MLIMDTNELLSKLGCTELENAVAGAIVGNRTGKERFLQQNRGSHAFDTGRPGPRLIRPMSGA
jgi:hypothetical protein